MGQQGKRGLTPFSINKLHFDIRQYSYVAWDTSEDLNKKLYDRIKATII